MNIIKYYLLQVEDKLLKRVRCVRFYQSRFGVKNFGASRLIGGRGFCNNTIIEIAPQNLYLGPDFLKDDFTLLECPLLESPHYHLMEVIHTGKPLSETDYMKRFTNGCLDWRRGQPMPKSFDHWYIKNNTARKKIIRGDYKPVIVYQQDNKYYIFDGKHRAAMCAQLGLSVKCCVVGSDVANADLWHYMFSIVGDRADYSKHITFHNNYLSSQLNG